MKHGFVFSLALASVGSVKGKQTITLSNGNMVAGAYKQPPQEQSKVLMMAISSHTLLTRQQLLMIPCTKEASCGKYLVLVRKTLLRNLHCHTGWILLLFQMVTQSMLKLWMVSLLNFHILCHQLALH